MRTLRLLIVEDDDEQIKAYQRDIKSFNLGNEIVIKEEIMRDKDAALEVLENKEQKFDAAIVDLRLDKGIHEDKDFSGNDVIRKIKGNLRFPIFVVTGTPQDIAEDLKEENSLFKIKTRGEEDDLLDQLAKIYNTGITKILGKGGEVERYLNDIFWKHLSTSMDMWITDTNRNSDQKEKSLLRYTLLHMQEYIDLDIEKYHPSEFYITDPVKRDIFTGDIVEMDGERYIVLTPSCDIVLRKDGRRKAQRILFCKIKELNEVVDGFDKLTAATGKNNRDREQLKQYMTNNFKQNFHFIPKNNLFKAGVIDFQYKMTLTCEDVDQRIAKGEIKRVATVSSPFLKDIISRYSSYYARQGAPDFDLEEVYQSLFN